MTRVPVNELKIILAIFEFQILFFNSGKVFENHRKSLIQHYERSELRLQFDWTKVHKKCQKSGEFLKTLSLQANSVTSQVTFSKTKIAGKSRNSTEILKYCRLT